MCITNLKYKNTIDYNYKWAIKNYLQLYVYETYEK